MFQARQSRNKQTHCLALCVALSALIVVCTMVGQAHPRCPQKSMAENLDGKPLDPFTVSANRVVVLLFVRTDCPISNRYAPLLQKLSEKFRGRADFWLVYPDRAETASQIKAHLQAYHYSITALRDTDHALVRRAQATTTPEAAVFDPSALLLYHGRIDNWYEDFGRSRPAATTHELSDAIASAIAGKPFHPDHANAVGCYISDLK
jgi:thiol-disulfide isomerase/thioredoxin